MTFNDLNVKKYYVVKSIIQIVTFCNIELENRTKKQISTVAEKITCVKERLEGILPIDENPETADIETKTK